MQTLLIYYHIIPLSFSRSFSNTLLYHICFLRHKYIDDIDLALSFTFVSFRFSFFYSLKALEFETIRYIIFYEYRIVCKRLKILINQKFLEYTYIFYCSSSLSLLLLRYFVCYFTFAVFVVLSLQLMEF